MTTTIRELLKLQYSSVSYTKGVLREHSLPQNEQKRLKAWREQQRKAGNKPS